MDYCNGVQGFINYVISNLRNINEGSIRCPCKRCKNKKISRSRCCNDASSTKNVHVGIHVLVYTRRTICLSRDHAKKNFKKHQFKNKN